MANLSKAQARQTVQTRLSAMTDEQYEAAARSVQQNVYKFLAGLQQAGNLHYVLSYRAVSKWREVDLQPLEASFPGVEFDYVVSAPDAPFPKKSYDIILVPLYGFNSKGYRLGHGSGWYDQFLLTKKISLKVGVGLEAGLIAFDGVTHDILMNTIITDRRSA